MDATQPLRILALGHDLSSEGCISARIITPLQALAAQGTVNYDYVRILPWRLGAVRSVFQNLAGWDVIVLARPRHSITLPIMQRARTLGKPVLIDLDDWLLDVPPDHPDARYVRRRPRQETLRWALRTADGITVSTPDLAERCMALGLRAHVLRNAIDPARYARHPRDPARVTIAFGGSPSHARDVALIGPPLRKFLQADNGKVRVVTVGCAIPELFGLSGYTHHDPVSAGAYPQLLSDLRIDIGLAPLYDTAFNRSKSDIKFLEYTAAGALTIASAVGPYRDSIDVSRGVLVAPNTMQVWQAAIQAMVSDAGGRRTKAFAAYEWLLANRTADAMADAWATLFHAYACRNAGTPALDGRQRARDLERVLVNVVPREIPYYGRELPGLVARKALATMHRRRAQ